MSAVQPVKHQGPARILMVDDNPSRLLARRPVRLVEDSSEEGRNSEYVQSGC